MLIFHRFLKFLYAAPTTITFFKVCLLGNIVFPPPADSNIQTLTTLNGSNGFFADHAEEKGHRPLPCRAAAFFKAISCACVCPQDHFTQWFNG